jgi:AraC-like DNA-binding protein
VAEAVGLDPSRMLARLRLDVRLLDEPNHPLPISAINTLIEQSAELSGDHSFGLRMCEARTFGSLGPLAVLLDQDSTCREVIGHLIRFQRLLGDAAVYSMQQDGDFYIFRTELQGNGVGPQVREYQMGLIARLLRDWLRFPWEPESVHFVHPAPADLSLHARIFRCPLQFDSLFNGFVCSSATLDAVREGGDRELAGEALRMMDELVARQGDPGFEARTRRAIRLLLPVGGATLEEVARSMDLSPRKVQRLLEEESKSFRDLLNSVRAEVATDLLSNPRHSIQTVAFQTGFATPTAFTRWFKEQFARAPSAWRSDGVSA